MGRIQDEFVWLRSLYFANLFAGRETNDCLESSREVVGCYEVCEMYPKLFVVVVVEAFDCRVFDRAAHALDLAVGPWVVRFCKAMLDTIGHEDHVEVHWL